MDAGEIYLLGRLYQANQQDSYRMQLVAAHVADGWPIAQAERMVDAHFAEVAANQGTTFEEFLGGVCVIGFALFVLFVVVVLGYSAIFG
jgi:hypothetical protein